MPVPSQSVYEHRLTYRVVPDYRVYSRREGHVVGLTINGDIHTVKLWGATVEKRDPPLL